MMQPTRRFIRLLLCSVLALGSIPALAGLVKPMVAAVAAPLVSSRVIVKFKPNSLAKGLSVGQINAQLSQPLTAQTMGQLQAATGSTLTEVHALGNGAHVLALASQPSHAALAKVIAGLGAMANVEYAEEDTIMSAQAVPNDPYYVTGPTGNPGLWGMQPVSPVALPAPGGTGSYGADFENAWAVTTGSGVVVAVVDTGITPHVDIVGPGGVLPTGGGAGNVVSTGYDFITDCRVRGSCAPTLSSTAAVVAPSPDASDTGDFISASDSTTTGSVFFGLPVSNSTWHGTHVSGTIAALGNNATGVIGGANTAKLLPVRVLGKGGGFMSDVANGLMWAANVYPGIANPNPAKVISLSLGAAGACSTTMQAAVNAAIGAGAVVVVAAGNGNGDVANSNPANCQNVISVAALARDGSRASYSNFSSPTTNTTNPVNVTIAAPGGDQGAYPATFDPGILSTVNGGAQAPDTTAAGSVYTYYSGTSMATPHVSAAVALMLARNPALTPAQVKAILSTAAALTAFPSFTANFAPWDCALDKNCGAGLLNAKLAVQFAQPTALSGPASLDFGSVLVNGMINQTLTLTNSYPLAVQVGAAVLSGANVAYFSVLSDGCNAAVLSPNGTCQITLRYAPTQVGVHVASLSVSVTGAPAPTIVALTGSAGTTGLTTSTPNVTAATVAVGQSTTVNVSYANPNAVAVKVGAVIMSQPAIMATSVDNCSNATLAAGASCTTTVTVSPKTAGAYSGTASLGLSGGGTPAVATISGTANPAPPPPAGGGGGGGCSVMPEGADPDSTLPLAVLIVVAYWLRQRAIRRRDKA